MAYEELTFDRPHTVSLEGRRKLILTGIREVESFDEENIVLHTSCGALIIEGQGLHIEKLSLDGGDVIVEGQVDTLAYEDAPTPKRGFFSRR